MSISRRVAKALQREFVEGSVFRVDLDRVDVAPAGSAGVLHSLPLIGDRDKVQPGDTVRVMTVAGERVALVGDVALGSDLEEVIEDATDIEVEERIAVLRDSGLFLAGGGGASALADLTDVDLLTTPPIDNDVLVWDADNSKWVPKVPVSSGGWTWSYHSNTEWTSKALTTTAKTKLDLSDLYGIPEGVSAVAVVVALSTTNSDTADNFLCLWKDDVASRGLLFDSSGQGNGTMDRNFGIIPCDENGDIYYQVSTTGTMTVYLRILGYYTETGAINTGTASDGWTWFSSNRTSTNWTGKVCSTNITKQAIDMPTEFNLPSGIQAVVLRVNIKDSGSAGATCFIGLAGNNVSTYVSATAECSGNPNNTISYQTVIVPVDANGNIYYYTYASGTNTLTVGIDVTGYLLTPQVGRANASTLAGFFPATSGANTHVLLTESDGSLTINNHLTVPEMAAPATPSSGWGSFYFGTDGYPKAINDAGRAMTLVDWYMNMPIGAFNLNGAAFGYPVAGNAGIVFRNGVTDCADFTFWTPAHWIGRTILVDINWVANTGATNVYWTLEIFNQAPGLALNSGPDYTAGVVATSGNVLVSSSMMPAAAFNPPSAGYSFTLRIARQGNDAADTWTGDAYLMAARLRAV